MARVFDSDNQMVRTRAIQVGHLLNIDRVIRTAYIRMNKHPMGKIHTGFYKYQVQWWTI